MFSDQFYEKRLSVTERNMKLLLETVTYIAIKERFTCIITMETIMCIIYCWKYHLHNCNRDSNLQNCNKSFAYVLQNCNRNSHMHNCNRKIHQLNCNRKYRLKTCKNATDVVTCIIAIESACCIFPTETATCRFDYRNFHLQKWCQSEILVVTIKKLS